MVRTKIILIAFFILLPLCSSGSFIPNAFQAAMRSLQEQAESNRRAQVRQRYIQHMTQAGAVLACAYGAARLWNAYKDQKKPAPASELSDADKRIIASRVLLETTQADQNAVAAGLTNIAAMRSFMTDVVVPDEQIYRTIITALIQQLHAKNVVTDVLLDENALLSTRFAEEQARHDAERERYSADYAALEAQFRARYAALLEKSQATQATLVRDGRRRIMDLEQKEQSMLLQIREIEAITRRVTERTKSSLDQFSQMVEQLTAEQLEEKTSSRCSIQ